MRCTREVDVRFCWSGVGVKATYLIHRLVGPQDFLVEGLSLEQSIKLPTNTVMKLSWTLCPHAMPCQTPINDHFGGSLYVVYIPIWRSE